MSKAVHQLVGQLFNIIEESKTRNGIKNDDGSKAIDPRNRFEE